MATRSGLLTPLPPTPGRWDRARRRLDRFIHHPATDMAVVALILVAVMALLGEAAFPEGHPTRHVLRVIGDAVTWLFVVELSLRFVVAPSKRRFFSRYWIDILAVLPLARPLRLLRVLLLLRLFRAGMLLNRRMQEYTGLLRGSLNEFTIVATLSATIVLVAALTLHAGSDAVRADDPALQGSLEAALWYAVFTLIGGEPIGGLPRSELGRAVTLVLMLGGLTVFGIFVGAVSASMTAVFSRRLGVNHMDMDELSDHVVVCGWNPAGPIMLAELFAPGHRSRPVVVVTERAERPDDLIVPGVRPELVYHHSGDYARIEVLNRVGISRASAAILLTDTLTPRSDEDRDARTVLTALTIERMVPGIFCCAELINGQHAEILRMARVEEVVVRDWYAGRIMGAMGRNRGLATVLDDILTSEHGNAFHKVVVPGRLAGTTVGALHDLLKRDHHAILVGLEGAAPDAPDQRSTVVNPPVERTVQAGDHLVVISPQRVRL